MSAENIIIGAGGQPVTRPGSPTKVNRVSGAAARANDSPATCRVRIHRDGLLVARCTATGLAPGRLFVSIDPLHYPVNSHLDLEFERDAASRSTGARQGATVTARNIHGIELTLEPAA
jgi:hypothetical protein